MRGVLSSVLPGIQYRVRYATHVVRTRTHFVFEGSVVSHCPVGTLGVTWLQLGCVGPHSYSRTRSVRTVLAEYTRYTRQAIFVWLAYQLGPAINFYLQVHWVQHGIKYEGTQGTWCQKQEYLVHDTILLHVLNLQYRLQQSAISYPYFTITGTTGTDSRSTY